MKDFPTSDRAAIGSTTILLLALLTALDAMAIDMYLPGMPAIAQDFGVAPSRIQQTLAVFLAGLALGQGLYGPLLDRYGRRKPLLIGIVIFVAGSVLAALAPSVEWLMAARFLQALGAAAGLVTPRAIVADLCTVSESARVFSLLMQVMMIAPIVAPILGGYLLGHGGWRAIFWTLAALGGAGLLWGMKSLPDSLPRERRVPLKAATFARAYARQATNAPFMAYTLAGGFVLGSLFSYISGSAFVFTQHFALTPTQFSLGFALNAASFFAMSQLTARLTARFGLAPLIRWSVVAVAAVMALLAATTLWVDSLALMMTLLFIGFGFLGLLLPAAGVLSLEDHGAVAGSASALLGAIQMITAALSMTVVGVFADHTPAPMLIGIALCAIAAMLTTLWTLRRLPTHLASAPPSS